MNDNVNKNNKQEEQFSIEKELADMKKSLLVDEADDEAIISKVIDEHTNKEEKPASEEKNEKAEEAPLEVKKAEEVEEVKEEAPKEEKKAATPKSKTEAKKTSPKSTPAKSSSKAKAPAKKTPAKKKALTEAQKAAQKEKAKKAKAKEAEKRRQAVLKAKEKEKTRLAVAQAKEKEKQRMESLIKREKERSEARAAARKAAEEKLASIESAQKTNDVITSELDEIKLNKDFISEAKGLEKIGPKKSEKASKENEPKGEENVSESLQRLREQIAAKKDLEQRIMDGKAAKTKKADASLISDNLKDLEAKNRSLKDKLEKAQAEVNEPVEVENNENSELAILRQEIITLETKVKELEAKESLLLEDNKNLKESLTNLDSELNNKYSEALKVKDQEYDNLQNRYNNDLERLNKEVESLRNAPSVDTSKIESNLTKEFNAKAKALEKEKNNELKAKQKELDQVNKELAKVGKELTKANNLVNQKETEFENVKNDLNQKLVLANNEIGLLKRDLDEEKARNVSNADIHGEVEAERAKLVEQNRELEKEKKELALQESYLNLYKQEIDSKANEQVEASRKELEKYKKENKVQEDLIRAEEQVKYQELNIECNDAKKRLAELTKDANQLEVKVIDYERKIASYEASLNSQNELNDALKGEVDRLNERVKELTNHQEKISEPSSELDELKAKLLAKEGELASLNSELEQTKERFDLERVAYNKQSEAINRQLEEMIKGVEENETSIANTALVIEHYREALENEKNDHLESEQQLYDALKAKDEEIKHLKEQAKQDKLDSQIDQIANMVHDLSRRDMYGVRPPYQSQYYAPFDPYNDRMHMDQQKEIEKRDEIIASLQKERKAETDALNAKIASLEAQIKDLNDALLKKEEKATPSINYQDLNEYSVKMRSHLVSDALVGYTNLADLLDAYQEAKKKVSNVYVGEVDKLNIANKYSSDEVSKQTLQAKRELLDDYYANVIKELDANLENGVNKIKEGEIVNPVVTASPVAPVVVDIEETAPVSDAMQEVVPDEEIKEVNKTPDGDKVLEEAPIYDSYEEKAEALEQLEPLEVKQTPLIKQEEDPNQVIITFDSEYLNKLNNIRRTRKSLEERKVVESANHRIELSNNENLQKEYARKIADLQLRIDELTANYQASEDHSEEAKDKFEVEKQKLFFELTSRQSQLNKLSDDDVRKINLRYHNIIKGIEDQLLRLEEEEKELRDTYILKQKKEQSKQSREAALQKQFADANVQDNDYDEPRIIESQDEIRERKFRSRYDGLVSSQPRKLIDDKDVANIVVNEHGDVVSGKDNKVYMVDKEKVKESLEKENDIILSPIEKQVEAEPEVEPLEDVKEAKISPKEMELRKKYDSFCQAEKVYSNDIASVREYKKAKAEYLSFEQAISENEDKIIGLNEVLKASSDNNEIANLKNQISELKAKGENLKDNRDYAKKQFNNASKDKHVKDYIKLIQKIEDAAVILKKYQAKREKKFH